MNLRGVVSLAAALVLLLGCERRATKGELTEVLKEFPAILSYERVPLAAEKNAFVLWQRAFEKTSYFKEKELEKTFYAAFFPWQGLPKGNARKQLDEWLAKSGEALDLLDAGIRLGRCQFPKLRGKKPDTSYLSDMRQLARMKRVKANLAASDGDFEAAAGELAGVVHFGELISEGEGDLAHYLIGLTIEGMGLRPMPWLVENDVPEAALDLMIAGLTSRPSSDGALANAIRIEFHASVDSQRQRLSDARPSELQSREEYAHYFGIASSHFARGVRNALGSWKERDRKLAPEIRMLIERLREAEMKLSDEAMEGEEFSAEKARVVLEPILKSSPLAGVAVLARSLDTDLERTFRHRADREATRAIIGLRLYEMRRGELPANLGALVDERILKAVPADPFSGGELKYSRERRVVWSVGVDETDDGGEGDASPRWSGKDYVWRVPAPN